MLKVNSNNVSMTHFFSTYSIIFGGKMRWLLPLHVRFSKMPYTYERYTSRIKYVVYHDASIIAIIDDITTKCTATNLNGSEDIC